MTTLTGTCGSPGVATGKIRHFQPKAQYTKSDIVVMQDWLTQHVVEAKSAGAILSATGGLTCHASIVARELKIPTLLKVDISKLEEGKEATVDAAAETVEVQ